MKLETCEIHQAIPYRFEDVPAIPASSLPLRRMSLRLFHSGRRSLARSVAGALAGLAGDSGATDPSRAAADLLVVRAAGGADTLPRGPGRTILVRARLSMGGVEAVLETTLESARRLTRKIVGLDAPLLDDSDLLTDIEQGILAFFVENLLRSLEEDGCVSRQILPGAITSIDCETGEIEWGESGASGWLGASGLAIVAGVSVPWRVVAPIEPLRLRASEGMPGACRPTRDSDGRLPPAIPPSLTWTLRAIAGTAVVSIVDFGGLESGDLVILDSGLRQRETGALMGNLELRVPSAGAASAVLGAEILEHGETMRLRILHVTSGAGPATSVREETAMDHEQDDIQSVSESEPLATGANDGEEDGSRAMEAVVPGLPVTVSVELGRLKMTVAQLADLRAGEILELARGTRDRVVLTVDDCRVGDGDLVMVEDRLAVLIRTIG